MTEIDRATEAAGATVRERTDAPNDPLLSRRLGPYRVERVLGAGGMGVVYLAVDVALDRKAAVKVLSQLSTRGVRRFVDEARRQARLDHGNVVSVYGAGSTLIEGSDVHYIAMKFVDGPSLADLVRQHGPLDPIDATSFILDAARGLYYVHAEGFIHRDVKPGNVLIDPADRALIADFGVALDADETNAPEESESRGEFLGTRAYASPEQLEGRTVDVRSDIFALGATWLFALTAREPGDDPSSAKRGGRLPIDPALPPRLRETLSRMIADDPVERYPSMLSCVEALTETLSTLERDRRSDVAEDRVVAAASSSRAPVVVVGLGMLALLLLISQFVADAPAPRTPPTTMTPSDDVPVESETATAAAVPLLPPPDAREISEPERRSDTETARHQRAAELIAKALAAPGRIPRALAELEATALVGPDHELIDRLDAAAAELAHTLADHLHADCFDVEGLEVDRNPITHAQYYAFLLDTLDRDPATFLKPLLPSGPGWISREDQRLPRPRLASLGDPVTGLRSRAIEALASEVGKRVPSLEEWRRVVAPLYALHDRSNGDDERYEFVRWDDGPHFAAIVSGRVVVRDTSLPPAAQTLRLLKTSVR